METITALQSRPVQVDSANSSPRSKADSRHFPTDSLVTIPLSDSTQSRPSTIYLDQEFPQLPESPEGSHHYYDDRSFRNSVRSLLEAKRSIHSRSGHSDITEDIAASPERQLSLLRERDGRSRSNSVLSVASDVSIPVDWEQLEKDEAKEEEQVDDDEQTTLLLARLEQENAALVSDPKSSIPQRRPTQSRPPSVHQLKKMVQEQGAKSVRFSLVPAAAPMTELEFWAALVRDYAQTAQRLPTITSSKIRGGIPPPLRGVVWVSMAGARNTEIEEQFDRLCNESSPYENTIAKDLGRSFPGVEMFKDPEGDGQRMLATVLKCYSLCDEEIGYCQGLGFLVGPLLMNMGDKQAFCILVRLMEDYDLRSCFLPNLAGLHLRIFQFKSLLKQHIPSVADHLDELGVEGTAYSQWFLSFFAVTCPLPLLFRIYDVIFAEGASETIMRVALAVIRRNERKLLEFVELEDAMRLLLSRQLWDPYGCSVTSGDELVNDLCDFTSVVTRESLQAIESDFRSAQNGDSTGKGFFPDVQAAASRFLGRLWAPAHGHTVSKASTCMVPTLAAPTPSRPVSSLHRTPSKQSLATLGSTDGGSDSSSSQSVSTALTEVSRESNADYASFKSPKSSDSIAGSSRLTMSSTKDKDLQNQIEDLLMACTELQREQNLLTAQLQREREERQEDHAVFRSLVEYLKDNFTDDEESSPVEPDTPVEADPIRDMMGTVTSLVSKVETRLSPHNRRSSGYETKASLRVSIAVVRDQLQNESTRSQELIQQLREKDDEASRMRDDLQIARSRIQAGHGERQRLEKTIYDLRQAQRTTGRSRASSLSQTSPDLSSPPSRVDTGGSHASTSGTGLRELRLMSTISNRSSSMQLSTTPTFSKRSSSLSAQAILTTDNQAPPEQDTLLLELVNAKTAEAVAKQELEELKARFDALRKMLNLTPPVTPMPSEPVSRVVSRSSDATAAPPMKIAMPAGFSLSPEALSTTPTPAAAVSSHGGGVGSWSGGGFFGWGKRSVSSAQELAVAKK